MNTIIINTDHDMVRGDCIVCVGHTSSPVTVTLLRSPVAGQTCMIKDVSGMASDNPIYIDANSKLFIMTSKYQSVSLVYTGSEWLPMNGDLSDMRSYCNDRNHNGYGQPRSQCSHPDCIVNHVHDS